MHDPARLPMRVPRVRTAWPPRRARADPPLGLWPALVHCQPELLPRVAVSTAQLWALPRRVRRALQRQWRLPLVGIALVLALGQRPGLAATIPVSDTCTLVDAITAATPIPPRAGVRRAVARIRLSCLRGARRR
jgi:hypothetical protein